MCGRRQTTTTTRGLACQGLPFFISLTNQEDTTPQGVHLQKNKPIRGSLPAPAHPQWVGSRVRPHTLQLTPTPPTCKRELSKSAFQNHTTTKTSKCMHCIMPECSYGLNSSVCLPNGLISPYQRGIMYDLISDRMKRWEAGSKDGERF